MSEKGVIIGILALIIGAGGLGIGIYSIISEPPLPDPPEQTGIVNTWYEEDPANFFQVPYPDTVIPTFNITFTVNSNESVLVQYCGYLTLAKSGTSPNYVAIYFYIDGVRLDKPHIVVGHMFLENESYVLSALFLQYATSTLTSGTHNVSIGTKGWMSSIDAQVQDSTLLVQTYIP